MSAFGDPFLEVFHTIVSLGGGNTIKFNGLSKPCVANGLRRESQQRATGYDLIANPTCEMLATDFAALNFQDREVVEIDGFPLTYVAGRPAESGDPLVNLSFEHQG